MDLLKNIFKGDKVIWIIFLCLCLISIIEVFSAASTLTYKSGDHWGPITQHSIILMVGAVVVVFLHNVPYKWFQVFPVFLYPVSLVLLAFVTLMGIITGDRVNGAARWMTFMGLQFQPSELAKMAVIIAVSFILSKRQDEYGANPNAFKYIMILTGLVFLLIAPENLSTAMLLFGVVCMMMFIGRVSSKKLFGMLGILGLVGGVAVGILMAIPAKTLHNTPGLHRFETWQNRVSGFFEKEEVPAAKFDIDKDAQVAHARIAIATSHVVGKGPGNSIQRDFLSNAVCQTERTPQQNSRSNQNRRTHSDDRQTYISSQLRLYLHQFRRLLINIILHFFLKERGQDYPAQTLNTHLFIPLRRRLQCQQPILQALLGILDGVLINYIAICLASARKKQGKDALVVGWNIQDTTRLWLEGWVASQQGWRMDVLAHSRNQLRPQLF